MLNRFFLIKRIEDDTLTFKVTFFLLQSLTLILAIPTDFIERDVSSFIFSRSSKYFIYFLLHPNAAMHYFSDHSPLQLGQQTLASPLLTCYLMI